MAEGNSFVILDKDTQLDGEIKTGKLILEGSVKGTIRATERVILKEGSYVNGEVHTSHFYMLEGSKVDGNLFVNAEYPESDTTFEESKPTLDFAADTESASEINGDLMQEHSKEAV
ncbi:MAG: polymer-forming cytoskeletal protein [Balneolaceae bacterium]|nr:polymer-forming cytoskeletal protein [Balneolaceae bacterium]